MIKLAVMFGGCSSEYDVSLESAYAVISHLDKSKYELLLIGISKVGDFYLFDGDINKIKNDTWLNEEDVNRISISTNRSYRGFINLDDYKLIDIDLVLPILHGKNGEDGTLQGLLELVGMKYVGCDMLSSTICMNKYLAHELVLNKGIKCAKSYLFNRNDNLVNIKNSIKDIDYPLYVKPLKAGSSFGISKVFKEEELILAIDEAFKYDNQIIIEENIEGFEVGVSILGNDELIVGEVDEIEISDGFFDYFEKYNLKTSKIHLPARISQNKRQEIKDIAKIIYKTLYCKDFARVDLFINKDGEIYFNEVNTIPGFTSHSRYPSMMKRIGLSFEELLDKMILLGLEDEKDKTI